MRNEISADPILLAGLRSTAVFTFHLETEPTTGELVYVFRAIGTHEIYRNP